MSAISVVHHPFAGSSSENDTPFSFPYSSSEYGQESSTSASATFTLNPASSRPPSMHVQGLNIRTPKTSLKGGGSDRPLSGFNMSAFGDPAVDENEVSEKSTTAKARPSTNSARGLEVWREIFLTSTGRDKALVGVTKCPRLARANHKFLEIDTVLNQSVSSLSSALCFIPPS